MKLKQAQAGNLMRHLCDIRRGVTGRRMDGWTDGQTDRPSYRDAMTHLTRPDTRPPVADWWAGAAAHQWTDRPTNQRTDGRTDGRTDKASYRVACPQLKSG